MRERLVTERAANEARAAKPTKPRTEEGALMAVPTSPRGL